MSLVHTDSSPVIKSSLDLFTLPPTETSLVNSKWLEFKTISAISNLSGTIEFEIAPSDNYYDLSQSFLYMTVQATSGKGDGLTKENNVFATNLTLHSLISQVDVYLSNTLITSSSNCYPYRAYLDTILGYSKSYAACQASTAMYVLDNHPENFGHKAIEKLRDAFTEKKIVEMLARLHSDIFLQDRYMLSNVGIRIVLTLNNAAFVFNESPLAEAKANKPAKTELISPKYEIKSASFFVRKQNVNSSVRFAHEQQLLSGLTAKYCISHVDVKRFSVSKDASNFDFPHIFQNIIPSRVTVVFVEAAALNGSLHKNPFFFQTFEMTDIALNIDGENLPYEKLTFQYDEKAPQHLISFEHLLTSLGIAYDTSFGLDLDRDSFLNGFAIYSFDIDQADEESVGFPLLKAGNARLFGSFKKPLAEGINAVIYCETPHIIQINAQRQVIFDFTT